MEAKLLNKSNLKLYIENVKDYFSDENKKLISFSKYIREFYGISSEDELNNSLRLDSNVIDYKNVALLQNFLTELGCIPSRKICGLSRKKHKKLSREIKRCRNLGLLINSCITLET